MSKWIKQWKDEGMKKLIYWYNKEYAKWKKSHVFAIPVPIRLPLK